MTQEELTMVKAGAGQVACAVHPGSGRASKSTYI